MLQRIRFINKEGLPNDMVLKIVKRQSKNIIVRNPEDDSLMTIPRGAVQEISEAKKEEEIDNN
jgi:hypothetical protein